MNMEHFWAIRLLGSCTLVACLPVIVWVNRKRYQHPVVLIVMSMVVAAGLTLGTILYFNEVKPW